jgi:hypothetical protein
VPGVAAEALNDDRLGRALDAIARELEAVVGSVGAPPSPALASTSPACGK